MINVKQLLENFKINTSSRSAAVAGVREYIETSGEDKQLEASLMFFYDIFGMRPEVTDAATARLAAQYAVDEISRNDYEFGNAPKLLERAVALAVEYKTNPKNVWQFVTPTTESSSFRTDSDAPVVPKKNKSTMAMDLYNTHVKTAATPLTNIQFVELLVKELGMTKSGARTYAHNCFKAGKESK